MHRELVNYPSVGSYPALLLLALFSGYLLLRWRCVRLGMAGNKIDTLVLFRPARLEPSLTIDALAAINNLSATMKVPDSLHQLGGSLGGSSGSG